MGFHGRDDNGRSPSPRGPVGSAVVEPRRDIGEIPRLSPLTRSRTMAGTFALVVYWIAVAATVVAHFYIVRGTLRAIAAAPAGSPARGFWEYVWALLPAIVVAGLLVATWQAMHPTTFNITVPADKLIPGALRS